MLNHPVESSMQALAVILKVLDDDELSEPHETEFNRIKASARFIRGTLRLADPTVAPTTQLNSLNNSLTQASNELTAFEANKNPPHITNAFNEIEAAVTSAQVLPTIGRRPNAEKLAEAIERFAASTDELVEKSHREQEKLVEDSATLKRSQDEMAEELIALHEKFSAQNSRVDAIVSEFQSQFSEAQENRVNKFQEFCDSKMQEFANILDSAEGMLRERDEKLGVESENVVNELKRRQKQAQDLVHVIGNIGVTGNYQQTANKDEKAANWLRTGAIAMFLAGATIIVITAFQVNSIDWEFVLLRVGAAIVFAIPGWYLAYESDKHRSAAARNRRIELELASLGPFMENLESEEKRKLRGELTPKYFGQSHEAKDEKELLSSVRPLKDLLETIVKLVKP